MSCDGKWLSVGGDDGCLSMFDMSGSLVYKRRLYGGVLSCAC